MHQTLSERYGNGNQRIEAALASLRRGGGVIVTDDENRENEGDLIFPAETLTESQVAMLTIEDLAAKRRRP